MSKNLNTDLSIVIPVFNEEKGISECLSRVQSVIREIDHKVEIIVVDDGSTDDTVQLLLFAKKSIPQLRVIRLNKNQGHMSAISAGLEASLGKYVVTIDSDLQDPPEHILEMLKIIDTKRSSQRDIEVVQAVRTNRSSDFFLKRYTASLYYKTIRIATGVELISNAADFRLMTRKVVDTLISLPEKRKVYRLLIPFLGFEIATISITREKRFAGKSKYNLRRMFSLAIDSILSFTFRPLRLIGVLGLIAAGLMLVLSGIFFILYAVYGAVPGWTSLVLLLLSTNAFIFASIGLLGEYVGRIYQQVQNRPENIWTEI